MTLLFRTACLFLLLGLFGQCQAGGPEENKQADQVLVDTVTQMLAAVPATPPPPRVPDYDTTQWTDLSFLDTSIVLDLRYATTNNFVEEQMYDCPRCFLRPAAARSIARVHQQLQKEGLGLKMFDCYRPRPIQWKLWDKVPDKRYVSDPRKGSMHNRGAAVDLTLVDANGQQLDMGTTYDFFGPEAWSTYTNLPDSVLAHRLKLKEMMEAEGFKGIRTEWWHFSFPGKGFALSDMLWNCQ